MLLEDYADCFTSDHKGKPCNNKACVLNLSNADTAKLIKMALAEGIRWEPRK